MKPKFLFLFLIITSTVKAEESTQVDKRLLLDDPQTVSSQMLSLQREIQTLQTKIAEIDVHQSQIQFLNAQVSQLQQENNALKLQIAQGSSYHDVQTLTTEMAALKALHLDHELPLLIKTLAALEALHLDQELPHLKLEMGDQHSKIQTLNTTVSHLVQENNAVKLQISQGPSNQDVLTLDNKMATFEALHLDQELPLLKSNVDAVMKENQFLLHHTGSTSFPIWGRKSCPTINGTELVYTGITAGKYAGDVGSGTNTLCMPHDPDSLPSDFPTTTYSGFYASLYGAEYQFTYKNVAIDDDVPCAICKVEYATTTMMVPAKQSCPPNWTLQYHGYLSASYRANQATEFICIDSDPKMFEGLRQVNSGGYEIYPVKAICGALPCPYYKQNQYLSCAVCSL